MVRSGYIKVEAFMCNKLNLKGNKLLIYAIIYGFTQRDRGFKGSQEYIGQWLNISRKAVCEIIDELVNEKLVVKRIQPGYRNKRLVAIDYSPLVNDRRKERFEQDHELSWLSDDKFFFVSTASVNRLQLKGNELILFSIIETYTRNKFKIYEDKIDYLRSWLSITPKTYQSTLESLIEKKAVREAEDEEGLYYHATLVQNKLIDKTRIVD